jgi:HAD superfamily hydrolase (TIGR01509 family)
LIKAVIFDLNGVFIQGPKLSEVFRDKFGVPVEEFLPVLKEIMAKIRLPNAGDSFLHWQPHFQRWGLNLGKEEFFAFWFGLEKEAPEMIVLARELKNKGLKLLIHSNNFAERADFYDKTFPFLGEVFDKVYYSWQTGFVKPDPRGYRLLLSENNLESAECLYFDDKQENIDIAKSLGLNSFMFTGIDGLKEILRQFGAI